jgi:hypothetical protein
MRTNSSSLYFLTRMVALQLLCLGLWWFVLYQPSLSVLRAAADFIFSLLLGSQAHPLLQVDSKGEWIFSIPVNTVVKDPVQPPAPTSVDSIDFAAPPENIAPFANGWFVYAGLALSVPLTRSSLRRALLGMCAQTGIGTLALFIYAEVNARGILASLHRSPEAFHVWILKLAYHIDYLVIPYAGPFLLLLLTHPEWPESNPVRGIRSGTRSRRG